MIMMLQNISMHFTIFSNVRVVLVNQSHLNAHAV